MATTNEDLRRILEEQGEERREHDLEVAGRLGNIEHHLETLNGTTARNTEAIQGNTTAIHALPCTEHGKDLVRLATTIGLQPNPRELGRLEEQQARDTENWKRVWEFVKYPLLLIIGMLVGLVATGAIP